MKSKILILIIYLVILNLDIAASEEPLVELKQENQEENALLSDKNVATQKSQKHVQQNNTASTLTKNDKQIIDLFNNLTNQNISNININKNSSERKQENSSLTTVDSNKLLRDSIKEAKRIEHKTNNEIHKVKVKKMKEKAIEAIKEISKMHKDTDELSKKEKLMEYIKNAVQQKNRKQETPKVVNIPENLDYLPTTPAPKKKIVVRIKKPEDENEKDVKIEEKFRNRDESVIVVNKVNKKTKHHQKQLLLPSKPFKQETRRNNIEDYIFRETSPYKSQTIIYIENPALLVAILIISIATLFLLLVIAVGILICYRDNKQRKERMNESINKNNNSIDDYNYDDIFE